jgi:nucleoside-diphosphate-sugar epimerase
VADGGATVVQGDFTSSEDLRGLDEFRLDAVVHLAAETGGCSEAAGLFVNVDGTRQLLRYLIGRGCERFVIASSITAVGCLDPAYFPTCLPIGDDEPCRATEAYGLSKWLMEEVVASFTAISTVSMPLCFASQPSWTTQHHPSTFQPRTAIR